MPASLVRLRIAGFKSFAEPATVEILPGLTGVIGPNGCGKSNVAEALRWAMGESSARTLRGGEMEDVIFAGTAARPGRNLAEVTLTLEDAAGFAPPPFQDAPELQVSRRIERGAGSQYRVNGREARARDVQTLFADLAVGARSSAMVGQGRVAALIGARPEERRAVLEEAAGIAGLHARRAEAEAKLRAAEANLARAEDLKAQFDARLAGLRRQARQAARYRAVSEAIRAAEAELLSLQRARAERGRAEAEAALTRARDAAEAAGLAVSRAGREAEEAGAAPSPLRAAEAEARTALERARVVREGCAAEVERARLALAAAEARRAQTARDFAHARQARSDAAAADERLAAASERLEREAEAHPDRAARAAAEAAEAAEAVRVAEAEANRATEHAAGLSASGQALTQLLAAAETRAKRAREAVQRLLAERARAASGAVDPARLDATAAERDAAETALGEARARLDRAERARTETGTAAVAAREASNRTEAARARLAAEAGALAEVLAVKDGERWPPMVDRLAVPAGLEVALGAVLGEELAAADDSAAARHWRELPHDPRHREAPALPGTRLLDAVQGPPALARALSVLALVETQAEGDAAQAHLPPGAALVSRAGAVWRWDGYTVRAGTPNAAAVRLRQRNRLAGLRDALAAAEAEAAAARAARSSAELAERQAAAEDAAARAARREADGRLDRARAAADALRAQADAAAARLSGLDEQLARAAPEAEEADAALAAARAQRDALPDLSDARAAVERARAALTTARAREGAAARAVDALARDDAARRARRRTLAAEREDWRMRAADAAGRATDLAARAAEAEAEHARLSTAPDDAARRGAEAEDALRAAEAAHRRVTAALSAATETAAAADRAARAAETAQAAARERVVRAEGALQQAMQAWGAVAERVLDRLGAHPDLPAPPADLSPAAEERARKRMDGLSHERDAIGPVNLRAEMEAAEVEASIETIERERDELGTAIAKLRGGIGHLNREGRERLLGVFDRVNGHFQAMFARMFEGGRAHLALVDSDDPLRAGLEIYAQPPGKKLASLGLLSGGEQALTALSLIFAVFRCNPAPVCVLDEVDAPLDDANVERFCALLDDVVRETGTRFLVVTHHRHTMARMDRLYGVTMQERGVSRLLSVDLQRAAAMAEEQAAAE